MTKLDQNFREILNAAGNNGYNRTSERRESQRGRSTGGSNKKRLGIQSNAHGSQRGHSAHHREDSYSKKESFLQGSNKKKGSTYASQKKQMENSLKSNKYGDNGYSSK